MRLLIKNALICTHFKKSEHWIKSGLKFLFRFDDILKGFYRGDFESNQNLHQHSINQRNLSKARRKKKKKNVHHIFKNK